MTGSKCHYVYLAISVGDEDQGVEAVWKMLSCTLMGKRDHICHEDIAQCSAGDFGLLNMHVPCSAHETKCVLCLKLYFQVRGILHSCLKPTSFERDLQQGRPGVILCSLCSSAKKNGSVVLNVKASPDFMVLGLYFNHCLIIPHFH